MVYRDGALLRGTPVGVMRPVFQWRFWSGSGQVALLHESLHGAPQFQAELLDLTSSRVLAKWSQPKRKPFTGLPAWAEAFRRYMQQTL